MNHNQNNQNPHLRQLHDLGQSVWLDNISRDLLDSGTLQHYIDEYSITGLTSNPSIFDAAIGAGRAYDTAISELLRAGKVGEELFTELALQDLRRAADLFRPTFEASQHADGWVSMEVSPLLVHDSKGSIEAASRIRRQANRPNLFVKIPGTPEGNLAIEEAIFAGIPINVTLLFSSEQYLASAEAYLRGIERRVKAGLNLQVASVASLFVSRWDVSVKDKVPMELQNKLGIAIGAGTYRAYRELLASARWLKLSAAGAKPQRLLWASTGTKDPAASDTLYVAALAAPDTVNTVPEKTLQAFAEHGAVAGTMAADGGAAEVMLERFAKAGIDIGLLAKSLQQEGAAAFVKSWQHLLHAIAEKCAALASTR